MHRRDKCRGQSKHSMDGLTIYKGRYWNRLYMKGKAMSAGYTEDIEHGRDI